MSTYDFAELNFAEPDIADGLARAYRILLERAYRRQQPKPETEMQGQGAGVTADTRTNNDQAQVLDRTVRTLNDISQEAER